MLYVNMYIADKQKMKIGYINTRIHRIQAEQFISHKEDNFVLTNEPTTVENCEEFSYILKYNIVMYI